MTTVIYSAARYMNDIPQVCCMGVAFYDGLQRIGGYHSSASTSYPMVYTRKVSNSVFEMYFRAPVYISIPIVFLGNPSTEIVSSIPNDAVVF